MIENFEMAGGRVTLSGNFFLRGPMLDRLNRYVRPLVEGS
jgi:hypothetical protein